MSKRKSKSQYVGKTNPTVLQQIPTFPKDCDNKYVIHAVIETPRDQRHKYAYDQQFGLFRLKTIISEGLAWPYDYGFTPGTLGDDGDPLDVLYLCDEPTFAGCLVNCRILGLVRLVKNGEENDRILAAAMPVEGVGQTTDQYDDVDDVPQELIESITRFLVEYPTDSDNKIEFKGVHSRKKALAAVEQGIKNFKKDRRKDAR